MTPSKRRRWWKTTQRALERVMDQTYEVGFLIPVVVFDDIEPMTPALHLALTRRALRLCDESAALRKRIMETECDAD